MSSIPTVLFVDEDVDALNRIFLHVEPVFLALSLRSAGPLHRYVERFQPDVVVLSDRLRFRRKDARALVDELRKRYDGRILVLSERPDGRERELWRRLGADDCLLHPTRLRDRLESLTRGILGLAADAGARPAGDFVKLPRENSAAEREGGRGWQAEADAAARPRSCSRGTYGDFPLSTSRTT